MIHKIDSAMNRSRVIGVTMSKIKVTPQVLQDAQKEMEIISRSMDEKLDTLRSVLQNLKWEGDGQRAYREHQQKWDKAVTDLKSVLTQIDHAVGIASENYISTEQSNSKLWG
jgi:6 kDa early secretory antigenic target